MQAHSEQEECFKMLRFVTSSASVMLLTMMSIPAGAAVVCVNTAGSGGCVKTIAAAVTAAGPGDIINVAAGTYKEAITIGKPLSLIGGDPAKTIIDATGLGAAIYVDGIDNPKLAGVTISGFTIQNSKYEGILVTNASGVVI